MRGSIMRGILAVVYAASVTIVLRSYRSVSEVYRDLLIIIVSCPISRQPNKGTEKETISAVVNV